MANVNAPFGFRPVRRLDGAPWNANQTVRKIAATNVHSIYQGDVVVNLNTGYIDLATPGTAAQLGIFVGCKYLSVSQQRTVWQPKYLGADANGDVEAYIIDDPLCVFQAQCKAGPLVLANVGRNVNFSTATAGSSLTGQSGQTIDDGTFNTTVTLPFTLIKIVGVEGMTSVALAVDPASAFNWGEVTFNNQAFRAGQTSL